MDWNSGLKEGHLSAVYRWKLLCLLLLAALACVAACGQDKNIVAKVGDRAILVGEVRPLFQRPDGSSMSPQDKKARLDSLIEAELLAAGAREAGLDKNEESQAALRDFERRQLARRRMDLELAKNVTEEKLHLYYESHKEEFSFEQRELSHVVFRVHRDNPQSDAEARRKANGAYQKLREGADFASLAKELSEDPPTAAAGGRLGAMNRNELEPALAELAFHLQTGEYSEPVKSTFGYHILKADGDVRKSAKAFAQVRGLIEHKLAAEERKRLLEDLQRRINVQVYEDRLP